VNLETVEIELNSLIGAVGKGTLYLDYWFFFVLAFCGFLT